MRARLASVVGAGAWLVDATGLDAWLEQGARVYFALAATCDGNRLSLLPVSAVFFLLAEPSSIVALHAASRAGHWE